MFVVVDDIQVDNHGVCNIDQLNGQEDDNVCRKVVHVSDLCNWYFDSSLYW